MKRDARSSAHDDDAFDPDERPTRPGAPAPEHLRALREEEQPPSRSRPAARRRPALTPATQSWLARKLHATPKTATSRWRAVAATVLGGGAGRASRVDVEEATAPPSSEPSQAAPSEPAAPGPSPSPPPVDCGPSGTMRMPARRAPLAQSTLAMRRSEPDLAGEARRALVRRCILAAAVALVVGTAAWAALRGRPRPAGPTELAAPVAPVALARPEPPPAMTTTAEPSLSVIAPSETAAEAPSVHPAPKHASPRRPPSRSSSSTF
jgi:hypothetical protein